MYPSSYHPSSKPGVKRALSEKVCPVQTRQETREWTCSPDTPSCPLPTSHPPSTSTLPSHTLLRVILGQNWVQGWEVLSSRLWTTGICMLASFGVLNIRKEECSLGFRYKIMGNLCFCLCQILHWWDYTSLARRAGEGGNTSFLDECITIPKREN